MNQGQLSSSSSSSSVIASLNKLSILAMCETTHPKNCETTHPKNWPKWPSYQGRIDPSQKLTKTTQAETTQDPNSPKVQNFTTVPDKIETMLLHNRVAN